MSPAKCAQLQSFQQLTGVSMEFRGEGESESHRATSALLDEGMWELLLNVEASRLSCGYPTDGDFS